MGKRTPERQTKSQPAAAPKGYPDWFTNSKLHLWGLFALSFLLYANTLGHGYALDDAIVIYDNMFVKEGISGVPGILSKDTFFGFFKEEGKAALVAGGRYRPLSLILFAIEVQFFGESPFVGHLFNGLYYGATTVLLYLVLLQLFRPQRGQVKAYFVALAASLLFAVHPIHTEVVANVKGRDEILTLLGSLGALYLSLRAFHDKKPLYNIFAGLVFFLALMAKENAIMFLFVAPLAYYFFTSAKTGEIIKQALPFAIAAGAFLAIRFSVLGFGLSDPPMEMMNNPFVKVQGNGYIAFTAQERFATVIYSLGKYLQLLFVPVTLTHDYYPRAIGVMTFGDWEAMLSLLLYLALGAYALWRLPKRDPMSFAILFYLITLAIVSNLFFPVGTHMAERLLFMPSVGFSLALALLGYRWAVKGAPAGKIPAFRRFKPVLGVVAGIALLFGVRTLLRNPVWADNYTLFTTDIQYSPNSAKLRNAVGGELVTQSVKPENATRKEAMLREAIGHLEEAVRIHPNYKNAYLLMGNAYNYLEAYDQSIAAYQNALSIDPNYRDANRNLGITYKDAGKYYGEQLGQVDKAITYLNKAYELMPDEYEVIRLLGVAHGIRGNTPKAIEYFTKATEVAPQNPSAWFDLGTAYYNAGDQQRGQQYRNKALELDPGFLEKMQSNN
jgi:tetratricopeptide (TPR) repeat protein